MADEEPTPREGRPVLEGLVALVAVALAVGLILGGGALLAKRLIGLDGDAAASDGSSGGETMYLPTPSPTERDTGPQITLAPDPGGEGGPPPSSKSEEPETAISLTSDASEVGSMERIYLRGTYPDGEGAILQVQQWEGDDWGIFPVTASVSNETFTTYIQTSQVGKNRFRVVDTDSGEASNEIRVTIR
ncbi:hypothetical protein [Nocardioides sp. cx-173]|uniref:hypothetical protein n=1 Tax=Nocardioides sp. cx-173 TaxID=2898796 RepID=UPI001E60D723|nr:hypothetical protein [Nocardioides sp. cx-173]MCD4524196.1 hypothetical protein [Nocardioides sp. cx-173]UGB41588.1 hypothetical protein LQ940_19815 [Nocardioides sp. cx-173]